MITYYLTRSRVQPEVEATKLLSPILLPTFWLMTSCPVFRSVYQPKLDIGRTLDHLNGKCNFVVLLNLADYPVSDLVQVYFQLNDLFTFRLYGRYNIRTVST